MTLEKSAVAYHSAWRLTVSPATGCNIDMIEEYRREIRFARTSYHVSEVFRQSNVPSLPHKSSFVTRCCLRSSPSPRAPARSRCPPRTPGCDTAGDSAGLCVSAGAWGRKIVGTETFATLHLFGICSAHPTCFSAESPTRHRRSSATTTSSSR